MADVELSRSLLVVADDLEERGYPLVGVLRQGARALATGDAGDATGDGCRGCGAALQHPARGRRRIWCSESCRRRHRP